MAMSAGRLGDIEWGCPVQPSGDAGLFGKMESREVGKAWAASECGAVGSVWLAIHLPWRDCPESRLERQAETKI